MTPERVALGWSVPDFGLARITIASESSGGLALTQYRQDAIHVLEGIRGCSMVRNVLPLLWKRSARVGIISESADARGLKGGLRRIAYTWCGVRHAADIDFLLAMGSQGVGWYRKCRFPESRIYPFAYTTDSKGPCEVPLRGNRDSSFALVFSGRCIGGKGVPILLRALSAIRANRWTLTVIGDGPALSDWQGLADELGIANRCRWLGGLPNSAAIARLQHADILLLPSTGKEGWGAVVNEALMQGVPVLCSDRCGARDLLAATWRGEVFKAGSVESLRDVLARWISRGTRTPELTQRIRAWSRCIEGESVADYFAAVLRHVYNGAPRPIAPWLCT
jgi:glycosyltransferase involved in cell wall biosynthesis